MSGTFFYDTNKQHSYDGQTTFSGGMVSQYSGTNLADGQVRLLENCLIDEIGKVRARPGIVELGSGTASSKIQGITYFDTPSIEKLITCANGTLYENSGSGAWSSLAGYTATNATTRVRFAQLIDKLYVLDGTKHLYYWDGTTWTDNSTDTYPLGEKWSLICSHTNKLFVSGGTDTGVGNDEIRCNDTALDGGDWQNGSTIWSFRVGGGEGQAIKQILSWYGTYLVVFKEQSTYLVSTPYAATSANDFSIKKLGNVGCVAPDSVVSLNNDVIFLSTDGVRSLNLSQTSDENNVSVGGILSKPIQDYINRINKTHVSKSVAEVFDDHYILWVPLDDATEPSHGLVWNATLQVWAGVWTGWNATAMCVSRFGDQRKLIVGDSDGDVSISSLGTERDELASVDYQDKGVDYTKTVRTRSLLFNEYINRKLGTKVYFTWGWRTNNSGDVSLSCYLDDTDKYTLLENGVIYHGVSLPISLPFNLSSDTTKVYQIPRAGLDANLIHLPQFNHIDFEVVVANGDFELQNVMCEAQVMSNLHTG